MDLVAAKDHTPVVAANTVAVSTFPSVFRGDKTRCTRRSSTPHATSKIWHVNSKQEDCNPIAMYTHLYIHIYIYISADPAG